MISYRLVCATDHEFDAWFSSAEAFDRQMAAQLLSCAICGTGKVEKAIMAPSVKRPSSKSAKSQSAAASAPVPSTSIPDVPAAVAASMPPELLDLFRKVRAHVRENSEYVGKRFADEALKIHLDEAEHRGIHGEATREEVKRLLEEGVDIHPLPSLPEDQN